MNESENKEIKNFISNLNEWFYVPFEWTRFILCLFMIKYNIHDTFKKIY